MARGVELWRGNSPVDGKPVVLVATWGSRNRKTGAGAGNLIQTWILRQDVSPNVAVTSGQDVSVCGGCPFRPFTAGDGARCYVVAGQAPASVWRAWKRGAYPRAETVPGPVRAGSYGDPAVVPAHVWARLQVVTGYTHQWRQAHAADHRAFLMASCDGPADLEDARAAGWRAFYARPKEDVGPIAGAVECPSGRGVGCVDCRLCAGARLQAKDVWIPRHGGTGHMVQTGLLRQIAA